jgi:MFS family permease
LVSDKLKKTIEKTLTTNSKKSVFGYYAIVIGAFLAILNSGMVIVAFGVFFKPVSAQFDWSRAETSGAFSLATIISGIVGIIAGRLGDRYNPSLVIIACGALEGIAYILLSQMNSLWQLYFYFGILVGTGMANLVPATSIVARSYQKQRGLMSGIAMAGAPVGSALVPPLATMLINRYDWSTSYVIVGCFALFLMVFCGICLLRRSCIKGPSDQSASFREGSDSARNTEKKSRISTTATNGKSLSQVIRSWPFWCFSLILFCGYFSQQDMIVHIVPHATDIGISPANAALILTIICIANIMGNYFTGLAADKISSRLSLIITMAILTISSLVLIFANSLWGLFIFAILFGIAWGGTSTLRSTMIVELFGLSSHGSITGAVFFISVLGGTIGPLLTGYIFDVSGHYEAAFIVISILSLSGLILSLALFRFSKVRKGQINPMTVKSQSD